MSSFPISSSSPTAITDEELRKFLEKIFDDIDETGDGLLSIRECTEALERANLPHDLESVKRMRYAIRHENFVEGGKNKIGRDITFEEFFDYYKDRYRSLAQKFDELYQLQKSQQQEQEQDDSQEENSISQKKKTILMSALQKILEKYLEELSSAAVLSKIAMKKKNDDAVEENENKVVQIPLVDEWKNPGVALLSRIQKRREEKRRKQHLSHLEELQKAAPTLQNEFVLKIFKKLDLDGDGEVTFEEFAKTLLLAPQFQLDAFLDGFLDNFQFYQDSPDTLPARQVYSKISSNPHYLSFKKAFCVFSASAVARIVTAPADRLRIIMMISDQSKITMRNAAEIIKKDGKIRGWFLGNGSNTIKLASELAVKLNAFDKIYSSITGDDPKNANFKTRMFAGGVAGLSATIVSQPSEVVRCTIAASPVGTYKGFIDAALKLYQSGGLLRFYSGIVPTSLSIIPFSAIDLTVNSYLKAQAKIYMQQHDQVKNFPLLFSCGVISSIVATISTFPLYVLRTRIAINHEKTMECARGLYKVGGVRAFYRGMFPALVKIAPASGVGYAVYDAVDRNL